MIGNFLNADTVRETECAAVRHVFIIIVMCNAHMEYLPASKFAALKNYVIKALKNFCCALEDMGVNYKIVTALGTLTDSSLCAKLNCIPVLRLHIGASGSNGASNSNAFDCLHAGNEP